MPNTFLRAEWKDLILANYATDPGMFDALLHDGLVLDLYEGQAVCSLVGFRFLLTRVMGIRWPGYVNFPEINLRFYVRSRVTQRRGVVFVRELVRSRVVAGIAKQIYNEPYVKALIDEEITEDVESRRVGYRFKFNEGQGEMRVSSDRTAYLPDEESPEHWFKEHQWGYGRTRKGRTLRYEVRHPVWECHRIQSASIDVDWGRIYGEKWSHMCDAEPMSVIHARGSGIEVRSAEPITLGN